MPLPHFTTIDSHNQLNEPIFKNLFEVVVILPPAIAGLHQDSQTVLLENTIKASFPKYPEIQTKNQFFKFSDRQFVLMPEKTSTTLDLTLNINVNQDKQANSWRMMKDWYDLVWNNEDGSLHYKNNIISDIIVHAHDKEGHVIRRVTYYNCQITKFSGWEEIDWSAQELAQLDVSFVADYWSDLYY